MITTSSAWDQSALKGSDRPSTRSPRDCCHTRHEPVSGDVHACHDARARTDLRGRDRRMHAGILMERERITPDQASEILRRASQHLNLQLREVVQRLIDTGEGPETGSAPSSP